MDPKRWQQVEKIYHSTLDKEVSERPAFLAQACGGDESLRREVESLLSYEGQTKDFIESPALEVAAKILVDEHGATASAGQIINQYRVTSRLGAGGMGEVFLAQDTRLGRQVALKFLPAVFTEDKSHLLRFEQEARAIATMSHPNVCTIHEVIETPDGRNCIVMEYVDGPTLRDRIKQGSSGLAETIDIIMQVGSALAAAHGAGIVHRDIKPENIMLRPDGYVKVLDFGLAKLTKPEPALDNEAATRMLHTSPGMVMGTVSYMSPEQARGLPVDERTDFWSLGVVLYETVAGTRPFQGKTPTDVIISIAEREPPLLSQAAPEAPAQLQEIVGKALAKERSRRYQTAEEMLADLKSLKRQLENENEVGHGKAPEKPEATTSVEAIPAPRSVFQWKRSRILWFGAIAAVLIVAGLLAARFFRRTSPAAPPAPIKTLAVLPMVNLSGDPTQDYFADGMTENLIAGLAKVSSLRVTSRTSVMQFKGSNKPLKDIARELNVDAIVEGSVQRSGDRVKVTVRLIHAASEQHLWDHTYDRDLRDVLTIENEVARAITQSIQITLTPKDQTRLAREHPVNAAAYDDYLRGRYYLNRQTNADNLKAIEMLSRAVSADPNFAAAHAELAQACVWRLFLFDPDEKTWEEKAFVSVAKALSLDPDLPEAHLARGRLLWTPANNFPHDQAIQEYRRALDLDPSLDEARNQLALVYGHVGLLDEALQEIEKAIAINPSNSLARFRLGETYLFQGRYEEALNALRNVPAEVNPSLIGHQIVLTLFNLGRKAEAAGVLDEFLKKYPDDNRGLYTSLQALLAASDGNERLAEEKIKLAIDRGKNFGHFHHTAYHIACAYALMNKHEQAVGWLEQSADKGFPCYPLFEKDVNLNNLRQDARFLAFLAKSRQKWEDFKKLL